SSCASHEMVLRKRLPLPCRPKVSFEAKSESPYTTRRAFLFSPASLVATTAKDIGPFVSVFSSKLALFDLRSVSAQLCSLEAKSCSALMPGTGGLAGVTDRTYGKKVIVRLKRSVILWLL